MTYYIKSTTLLTVQENFIQATFNEMSDLVISQQFTCHFKVFTKHVW